MYKYIFVTIEAISMVNARISTLRMLEKVRVYEEEKLWKQLTCICCCVQRIGAVNSLGKIR